VESVIDRVAELQGWIESRADAMAGLLEDLVAVDTGNPPGRGLGACASVLRDALGDLNLSPTVIELAASGDLENPCIVRAEAGDGPRSIYSTSSRPSAESSSLRSGGMARSSGAAARI
jgi:hypothetical protein